MSVVPFLFVAACVFVIEQRLSVERAAVGPSEGSFSGVRAMRHWRKIAMRPRPMSSGFYNETYEYVLDKVMKLKNSSTIYDVEVEEQVGVVNGSEIGKIHHVQRDTRNIVVRIKGGEAVGTPIMISAHIDSKSNGPGAYDDAAGISAMLEIMEVLCTSEARSDLSLVFLFVGVEELGLQGASLFLRNAPEIAGFVNVESLGTGLPLVVMQKGNGSMNTVRALASSPGMICATFADDITRSGLISSTSDAVLFRRAGVPGAELLYIGNPTKYHTAHDSVGPSSHIQTLGDHLMMFIKRFERKDGDENGVSIGIWPFILSVSHTTLHFTQFGTICISFVLCIQVVWSRKDAVLRLLLGYLLTFVMLLVVLGCLSLLMFRWNTMALVDCSVWPFLVTSTLGFILAFSILSRFCADAEIAVTVTLLFDILTTIAMWNLDSSVIFVWRLVFIIIGSSLPAGSAFRLCYDCIGSIIGIFFHYILFRVISAYAGMIPGFLGELVPLIVIFVFIVFVSLSFLPYASAIECDIWISFTAVGLLFSWLIVRKTFTGPFGIQGVSTHFFDSNSSDSTVMFIPNMGPRSIRRIARDTSIPFDMGHKDPLVNRPAFIRRTDSALPSFVHSWPEFSLECNDKRVTIDVSRANAGMSQATFVIDCGLTPCIDWIGGFDNVTNFEKSDKTGHRVVIRVMPASQPFQVIFNMS